MVGPKQQTGLQEPEVVSGRATTVPSLAPQPRRTRRLGKALPLLGMVAVVASVAAAAMWVVSRGGDGDRDGSAGAVPSAIRPVRTADLARELVVTPPDQADLIADGVVTDDELSTAFRATVACYGQVDGAPPVDWVARGSQRRPTVSLRFGDGTETPGAVPPLTEAEDGNISDGEVCRLRHFAWVAWAWQGNRGSDDLLVFFHPGSTAGQMQAVRDVLESLPGAERVSYVDQAAAFVEFGELYANNPPMLDDVDAASMPPSLRVRFTVDATEPFSAVAGLLSGRDGVRAVTPSVEPPGSLPRSPYPDELVVASDAMTPTLHRGQLVKTKPVGKLRRNDVVVTRASADSPSQVLRVVGLPTETVRVDGGSVWVDGERLSEPYVVSAGNSAFVERTLAGGQYWLMGDNRADARDSRSDGPIDVAAIVATVVAH